MKCLLAWAMALRQELAELMGYRHFADMQAAKRMMGSGAAALAFVDELLAVFKPAFDAEAAEYLEKLSRVKGEHCALERAVLCQGQTCRRGGF